MVNSASSFSLILEQRLSALGTNAFAAEQAAGLPQDAIRNVIRSVKKDGPSISRAKEICDALGLEFYIGPKRELAGFSEGVPESDLGSVDALRAGYLPIPWHDLAGRRGSAPVALQSSWLASEGLVPDGLKAIMPEELQLTVLAAGQTVAILDTTATQRGSNSLWGYTVDGKIVVGQMAFAEDVIVTFPVDQAQGKVRIIRTDTQKNFAILGRVVWLGGMTG
mgnify:CR=1 FL=1